MGVGPALGVASEGSIRNAACRIAWYAQNYES